MRDHACRVPRRAAGEFALVQQNNIAHTHFRQMIRDARTCNAAADNDDARVR